MLLIIAALVVLWIVGTIYGKARSSEADPLLTFGKPAVTEQTHEAVNDDVRVFSGIGRLRIPLSNSSTMLLSIAFPYSAGDIAFTEELAARIGDLKAAATDYFSSLPADKLINIDETAAKTEILRRYNNILRLGRIEALYFSDMLVID
jgi:flagellar basal body-associated protein FliL